MNTKRDARQLVAVTGIGMICPLGVSTHECWENMLEGKSGVKRISRFDVSDCLTKIAGQLPDKYFDWEKEALPRNLYRHAPLAGRLCVSSAWETLKDAQLDLNKTDVSRTAVITGCGNHAVGDEMVYWDPIKKKNTFCYDAAIHPAILVSAELGFKGPAFNIATACASGAAAIGLGYDYVRQTGELCLAFGADSMIFKRTIKGFNQIMALSERNEFPEKASRPFEKNRDGFVISEGVCSVLLEPYERAVRRDARIYALMSGYAFTAEAFNIMAPEPKGKAIGRTLTEAIQNAGIDKSKIGYISAHGTSTPYNDLAETRAVKRVFGPDAYNIPISSQKSMIGHAIGAAGAIEFAATALSLNHQVITPTINYDEPDPECDLDYVPNQSRKVHGLEAAITNSFGFGGHNISIVLENHESIVQ